MTATNSDSTDPVLEVKGLTIDFPIRGGEVVHAVKDLSFSVRAGSALGIVGQSGSGKSATALSLLGLHRGTPARVSGQVLVDGVDLVSATDTEVRKLRASKIAMVFQDPLTALDPFHTIGDQISEVYRLHTGASRAAARTRTIEVLEQVRIPDAGRRHRAHPHEFSGGMRQRALIAMALACRPAVLVADEPTTALDVTVQAQILDLLAEVQSETGMALVLISHDLGVVAGTADEVVVMHQGVAVESGSAEQVLLDPQHAYTQGLLAAMPRLDSPLPERVLGGSADETNAGAGGNADAEGATDVFDAEPAVLVRIEDVAKHYRRGGALLGRRTEPVRAVDGVSLDLRSGETLGLVGESGSGKTTLARMLVRLLEPSAGSVVFSGTNISAIPERQLRPLRRDLQMVFQDPLSSLNPRRSVGETIADPLRIAGQSSDTEIRTAVRELMTNVGLDPDSYDRFPHEFSGGMRQRVGIARALALRPKLLVCDEPVASLDVSTQAVILDLLRDVQREYGLTVVFVAHDLAVVRQIADRVAVMRHGRIVELADTATLFDAPQHEYTRTLLDAVPILDPAAARAQRARRREALAAA
ncbi:ABC transporter ATP-binding protein [Catenulispora rubra]|uniref:ABC transporter ATP-binding protein n=1 Tax=Catenulispora rubra TaxID=280293 RepID=UPI00189228AC|nr:ABC transporter ATP-binding protein [Catenulispora rubra]